MRCGVLFSGGKDSTYAAYLAKKKGYDIGCLISIFSENPESYMFHTPSVSKVEKQAEVMEIPLITQKTKGIKESELGDLEKALQIAKNRYKIGVVVTGAVESVYQKSRIEKICDNLGLKCFNPLWKMDQIDLLKDLIINDFTVVIVGVFAFPLDSSWLGRVIDEGFVEEVSVLYEKYDVNPAGEGGEFETFVLDCPLFSRGLNILSSEVTGSKHSWKMEIKLK
jgi:ABC transporter with metal-binding/Fe-S-binding domain ATP-binding protein